MVIRVRVELYNRWLLEYTNTRTLNISNLPILYLVGGVTRA